MRILFLLLVTIFCFSNCKKDFGSLNNPTENDFLKNASKEQLNNLVAGTESGMRIKIALYLDDVSVIGREVYRFSPSEPAYTTNLLGMGSSTLSNAGFYITAIWAANYRVVKNCNLLEQACANTSLISDAEKAGYSGFAKTIKAYSLLLNLNLTYSNGIRVDVADPGKLGPIVGYDTALNEITKLLDAARSDLARAAIIFPLSNGYTKFNDAGGLIKFNRAIAARVALYSKKWTIALEDLHDSFLDLAGSFSTGIYSSFGSGSGDILNPVFTPQDQNGEIRVAHPSYAAGIEAGDDRISKATLRSTAASLNGLSGNRDVWVYTSSVASIPIIRNEELILIYAEASIQNNDLLNGLKALNIIRYGHGLPGYAGAFTQPALITEMLKQRNYSLYFEGHRWIDMRRYNLLSLLPIDRIDDDAWLKFPLPLSEF
ncbi:RagB/SusD family nutrient uptake outer membrane protein [Ferruginibacter sp. SUN106]|uniref:RagB/SusD family nutrient uptake outer membrane protein n=1 Tax=Ferruginibacter sp. SUN106 TaxID=2978348 RepID=UPI003D365AE9